MKNIYKYTLIVLIVLASGFLTYQHYADPIYRFRIGRTINIEDKKIEDWGGRFPETETLYMGFRTRLEPNEVVTIEIKTSEGHFIRDYTFTVQEDNDFYYVLIPPSALYDDDYMAYIIVDEEILESMRFALDAEEE